MTPRVVGNVARNAGRDDFFCRVQLKAGGSKTPLLVYAQQSVLVKASNRPGSTDTTRHLCRKLGRDNSTHCLGKC